MAVGQPIKRMVPVGLIERVAPVCSCVVAVGGGVVVVVAIHRRLCQMVLLAIDGPVGLQGQVVVQRQQAQQAVEGGPPALLRVRKRLLWRLLLLWLLLLLLVLSWVVLPIGGCCAIGVAPVQALRQDVCETNK